MYSIIGSNIIFNIIEYFSFINLCLLFLFIIISLCFILISCTLLYYSNVNINHCLIEFISTLFSLLFLILIISPALIILLDFDLIILPSFIIYSLGLQWAWQFNIIFLPINIGFQSYCDHYIISSINKKSTSLYFVNNTKNKVLELIVDKDLYLITNIRPSSTDLITESLMVTRYLFDISQYIILPIYSFIRLFVYSFDVIHTAINLILYKVDGLLIIGRYIEGSIESWAEAIIHDVIIILLQVQLVLYYSVLL